MANITRWEFATRSYEIGPNEQVQPHVYSNYCETAGWYASSENGWPIGWYKANAFTWIIRRLLLRYYSPATFDDHLYIDTWVQSTGRRTSCFRHYDLRRAADDLPVARAVADFVFLNTQTMRPERIPEEFVQRFMPVTESVELDTDVIDPITIEEPIVHTEERRVQCFEIDSVGHTNNAVYLAWVDQAITDALRAAGWPPERYAPGGEVIMSPVSHSIEFFRSALENEPIWVITQLAEVGRDRASWTTEIRHSKTGEILAKDSAVKAFTDAQGPRSIPDTLHLALMKQLRTS
ncbi:MAG TPA: thioesterase family protein [Aggregatilineales bacterium]|nr:thioesterase family protein [Aggregatilineales bacterium]